MGCCGDKQLNFCKNFTIEVLYLDKISSNDKNKVVFTISKKGEEEFLKIEHKTLLKYIEDSSVINFLGTNFVFTINNPLFYCYIDKIPIIKNYFQIKDLIPFNFEQLWKISILNTEKYDELEFPKINLIQETKFLEMLENAKIDFTDLYMSMENIKNPELTVNSNIANDDENIEDDSDEEFLNNTTKYFNGINKNDKNEYFYYISEKITYQKVKNIYSKLMDDKNIFNSNHIKNQKYLFLKKDDINIFQANSSNFKNDKISIEKIQNSKEDNFSSYDEGEEDENKDEENQNIQVTSRINKIDNYNTNQKCITNIIFENINFVDDDSLKSLINILIDYPFLIKFGFNNFHLEKEESVKIWEGLFKLFKNNYNIRFIDLYDSSITDAIIESLSLIFEDKRIRYINFSENYITRNGAKYLSSFLHKNKTLQTLKMNNNDLREFTHEGIDYIVQSLYNHPNIRIISFSYMTVTGCGKAVGELIKNSKSLVSINLKGCDLNTIDFKNICTALSGDISKTIKSVNLSHNDMAGNKSLEEIGKMLGVNKTLTYLNLSKMNINMDNYQLILNGISENKNIRNFYFSYNPKIKPRIILEYFFYRKELNSLAYIPYKESINGKKDKIEFNLDEKKFIEKFKYERKDVKLKTK